MTPESSILRLSNGLYELTLSGFFPHPHWMVFLFAGLAESRVSVVAGKALQDRQNQWDAEFRLDFGRSSFTPESLNYVALSHKQRTPVETAPPKLTAFRMKRRLDKSLEVHLEGPDQLGFLGRFLGEVSLMALFPVELEVNTTAGHIQDRVVFRGFAGLPPGEHVDASLESFLSKLSHS